MYEFRYVFNTAHNCNYACEIHRIFKSPKVLRKILWKHLLIANATAVDRVFVITDLNTT